jgi:glycerol uptake facilitator-like aquaporin
VWQDALDEFVATVLLLVLILVLLEWGSTNIPIGWFFSLALVISVMLLVIMEGPFSMVSLNAASELGRASSAISIRKQTHTLMARTRP